MNNTTPEPGYARPAYAWYVVVILFLAYTLAYIDRQIIALLVEPIKRDLLISDTQISLLQGFAFVIFYTITGIPLGRLADRKNRRLIIAAGIFLWSIMTAVCGLARNFWSLFLARVGVGIGEACLSPAAYSMIADLFPKDKRGVPISFYAMGIYCGAGMAFIVGGFVIELVSRAEEIVLPLIGIVRPWQMTFFIVGIPGLILVAILLLTVKEPPRHELVMSGGSVQHLSMRDSAAYFFSRWRTYGLAFLGYSLKATLSYGYFAWIPSMYIRTFGWSAGKIGLLFGLVVAVLGTLGILLGGVLVDRMVARGRYDSYLKISVYGATGAMLFGIPSVIVPDPYLALLLLCPTIAFLGTSVGLAPGAINFITPNELRGLAIGAYVFVVALISITFGPTSVALVTDYVFRDPNAVRYSLAVFTLVFGIIACCVLLLAVKPFLRSVAEMQAREAPN